MCGIFGYIGEEREDLSGHLLDGLSKLEYRGYDSAGIAILKGKSFKFFKEIGEIAQLAKKLKRQRISGSLGIGHTRWATHGAVTKRNSHPHKDCTGKIAVVHNGIIENHQEIKRRLLKNNHKFVSETDTEVFAHLVEEFLSKNKKIPFIEAVRLAFNEIQGLNAVVVLSKDHEMVAFRQGSPLVVGVGRKANYVSSDIPALISITSKIILLEEREGVYLTKGKIFRINAKTGGLTKSRPKEIKMEETLFEKGSFNHFLLKEIYEQPQVLIRVAANSKDDIKSAGEMIREAWGTYITSCGTAAHAGLAATYHFAEIAKRHVNFSVGSEFVYFEDFLVSRSLLIAASQSGETMDTLEAVRAAKRHKSRVLALVNVPESSLARLADKTILLKAGPERAVLSTKAYVAKLATFLILAYEMAGKYKQGVNLLKKTSKAMSRMMEKDLEEEVSKLAKKLVKRDNIYIIGRGVNYATALEGALKIKEASYIHAEGFAGGELKHGVIALVEKGTPCIVVVAEDRAKEEILSNAMELKSRGAYIVGISPSASEIFDYWIPVPDVDTASPIINIVPMQLLAYHLAILKGYNPDKPRNLAKSVTVK